MCTSEVWRAERLAVLTTPEPETTGGLLSMCVCACVTTRPGKKERKKKGRLSNDEPSFQRLPIASPAQSFCDLPHWAIGRIGMFWCLAGSLGTASSTLVTHGVSP